MDISQPCQRQLELAWEDLEFHAQLLLLPEGKVVKLGRPLQLCSEGQHSVEAALTFQSDM